MIEERNQNPKGSIARSISAFINRSDKGDDDFFSYSIRILKISSE